MEYNISKLSRANNNINVNFNADGLSRANKNIDIKQNTSWANNI